MVVLILPLPGPHYFVPIFLFGRTNHVTMTVFIFPMLVNHYSQNQDVVSPIISLKFKKEMKLNFLATISLNFIVQNQKDAFPKIGFVMDQSNVKKQKMKTLNYVTKHSP